MRLLILPVGAWFRAYISLVTVFRGWMPVEPTPGAHQWNGAGNSDRAHHCVSDDFSGVWFRWRGIRILSKLNLAQLCCSRWSSWPGTNRASWSHLWKIRKCLSFERWVKRSTFTWAQVEQLAGAGDDCTGMVWLSWSLFVGMFIAHGSAGEPLVSWRHWREVVCSRGFGANDDAFATAILSHRTKNKQTANTVQQDVSPSGLISWAFPVLLEAYSLYDGHRLLCNVWFGAMVVILWASRSGKHTKSGSEYSGPRSWALLQLRFLPEGYAGNGIKEWCIALLSVSTYLSAMDFKFVDFWPPESLSMATMASAWLPCSTLSREGYAISPPVCCWSLDPAKRFADDGAFSSHDAGSGGTEQQGTISHIRWCSRRLVRLKSIWATSWISHMKWVSGGISHWLCLPQW